MKRQKHETENMFIGVDGFSEIESLTPQAKKNTNHKKTEESAVKKAAMAASMKNATKRLKAVASMASAKLRATRPDKAEQFAHSQKTGKSVYKKRAVLTVAVSVTATMLSLVTVASALDAPDNTPQANPAQKTAVSETTAPAIDLGLNSLVGNTGTKALYIDGELIGATSDGAGLQAALDKLLLDTKAGYDDTTTTEFVNKVEIKPYVNDANDLVSVDTIMAAADGKFSIALSTDWIFENETAFETEVTYDDSQPSTYELVTQEGKNGLSEVTIRLTYTDGVQTDAVITDTKTIEKPINKQVTVGCSDGINEKYSEYYGESGAGVSTGNFIWPLPHTHTISSPYEWRWGRMHNGIDIAGGGDYGMPIIASDGGTVVWSGDDGGGYGYYVMIDHGNGYTTVYGHASELACSIGDYVSQGQTIAYVGSTGNSTGPHLHFEIRYNGSYLDPLGFVS